MTAVKILLPHPIKKSILACGADTKGTFALAKGKHAYIFQGYGDLSNVDNFKKYNAAIKKNIKNFKIAPEVIACDLHPNYISTNFAAQCSCPIYWAKPKASAFAKASAGRQSPKLKTIQHHRAHIASAIAENSIRGEVIGVAFDGTGYGEDGNIWGGEFFIGGLKSLKRFAYFDYVKLPGGESSIKNPWQTAVSYLHKTFGRRIYDLDLPLFKKIKKENIDIVIKMIENNFNCPKASSVGRFFDAVSSLLGLVYEKCGEAEGPMKLEKIAQDKTRDYYNFKIKKDENYVIITDDIIKGIIKDIRDKRANSYISTKFHNTIAAIILKISKLHSDRIKTVVLSGGVFLNKVLTNKAKMLLERNGFNVYTQSDRTTTDAGIPLGQVALAIDI